MRNKDKGLYQGDFYKYYRKVYPDVIKELGSKWTPERWNPRYNYFSESCYGWRTFLDIIPKEHKQLIRGMTFEFLTKPLDVEQLMSKVQTTVNNYWNKIVVCKTIDTDEERNFRTLINGIKELSELSKKGTLRISQKNISERLTDIDAKRFTCSEIPPESKFINNRVYITDNGCWWEVHGINLSNNNSRNDDDYEDDDYEAIYFKSNEPKKVPEMKCTFQDGVFMAIPGELIGNKKLTQRFTKLLTDDTESGKTKNKKKKKLTHNELSNLDYEELIQVVRDYDLDIPYDDDIDNVEDEDLDSLQEDIERALGINRN